MPIDWSNFNPHFGEQLGSTFDPTLIDEKQNRLADLAAGRQLQQMKMIQTADAMNKTKQINDIMQQTGGDPVKAVHALLAAGHASEAAQLHSLLPKPAEPYTLKPSEVRFGSDNKPVSLVPEKIDYNKPFLPDGTPNPGYQQYELNKTRLGKPDVSVKIDNKMGEGIAKEVGPMMAASKAAAEGAVQQMDVANRLDSAINSGKVYAGPGANLKLLGTQIGNELGLAGKDANETLSNTRTAIQSLAQFSLTGRASLKGQGQISDYEGKLLAKATSGDIADLTIPELKVISNTAKRVAKAQSDIHQKNMGIMRSKPELKDVADFYDAPSLSGNNAASGSQPTALPAKNTQGWVLHRDANGNQAYVGPNGQVQEVR